jgi:hypothetical protein
MRNIERFKDKIIIWFCCIFSLPLPKYIQKSILKAALLNLHRSYVMCDSLRDSIILIYKFDLFWYPEFTALIPIFNPHNFHEVTGIDAEDVSTYDYWCSLNDRYSRIKFLNWCIKQL